MPETAAADTGEVLGGLQTPQQTWQDELIHTEKEKHSIWTD